MNATLPIVLSDDLQLGEAYNSATLSQLIVNSYCVYSRLKVICVGVLCEYLKSLAVELYLVLGPLLAYKP